MQEDVSTGCFNFHESRCFSFPQLREFQQRKNLGMVQNSSKIKKSITPEASTGGDIPLPDNVSLAGQAAGDGCKWQ